MERLSLHILSLLRLYDRVAMPGVGFFIIEYLPAHLDRAIPAFLPPSFTLKFDLSYTADDNLLLGSYARKEQYDTERAWAQMKSDIDAFLDQLDMDGEVALPGIGIFTYEEDEIEFTPTFSLNYDLPVIQVRPIERVEETPAIEKPLAIKPEIVDIQPQEVENSPAVDEMVIIPEPEETPAPVVEGNKETPVIAEKSEAEVPAGYYYHKPDHYYIPIHKTVAKIAACLLLVVMVGLATLLPFGSAEKPSATASILPIEVNKEKQPKSDSNHEFDRVKYTEEKSAPQTKVAERPLEATTEDGTVIPGANSLKTHPYLQSDSPLDKYYAVVAAMKTDKEVDKFLEMHSSEKSKYTIIRNKNNKLVTVASANDRSDLDAQMPLIRTDYPDAWVFTVK